MNALQDVFFDASITPANTPKSDATVKPVAAVTPTTFAQRLAADFRTFLDRWHASPEIHDNELDAWIHRIYADVLSQKPLLPPRDMPYFSPSSSSSCRRELYEKIRGAAKDADVTPPHQGRWKRIGTAIGDVIQRDLLMAERHFTELTGEPLRFAFERTDGGLPMFEDFAKRSHVITHNGKTFALYGTGDGILEYVTADGEIVRVGLEIKSKQTTCAQTSDYSTRNGPKPDHVAQCTAYAIMYNVDFYVILYVNASKKSWEMSDADYAKNPDIAVFGVEITPFMKTDLLDGFASIVDAAETGNPPLLDIERWAFNNFKRACALSLTDVEVANLAAYAEAIGRSTLPEWQKRDPANAIEYITAIRPARVG